MMTWKRAPEKLQVELSDRAIKHAHLFSTTRASRRPQPSSRRRLFAVSQALTLTVILTGLLAALLGDLRTAWEQSIAFIVSATALNVTLTTEPFFFPLLHGEALALELNDESVSAAKWMFHWTGVLLGLTAAAMLSKRRRSAAMALGALCAWHAIAIAHAGLSDLPAYDLREHTSAIFTISVAIIFLTPALLGVSYFLFEPSWLKGAAACLLIVAYFIISLPIKLVIHAWLAQLFSVLVLPLLFLVFGPIFDVAVFAVLYAWAVSSSSRT